MADKVHFELVSPEKLLTSAPVDMVVVPGGEGDYGVLAGHSPMITSVRPGVIEVREEEKVIARIFVAGGFAEVTETRCTVLAEQATPVGDIDVEATEKALRDATEDVADAENDNDRTAAEARVVIASAKLEAAKAGAH